MCSASIAAWLARAAFKKALFLPVTVPLACSARLGKVQKLTMGVDICENSTTSKYGAFNTGQ